MLTALVYSLASLVVAAVVPTGAALGVRYLNRRWNLQLTELEMQQMQAVAHEAITASDQKFKNAQGPDTNRDKLEFAVRHMMGNLERAGVSIDRQVAEEKIEAAVGTKRSQQQAAASQAPVPVVMQP